MDSNNIVDEEMKAYQKHTILLQISLARSGLIYALIWHWQIMDEKNKRDYFPLPVSCSACFVLVDLNCQIKIFRRQYLGDKSVAKIQF